MNLKSDVLYSEDGVYKNAVAKLTPFLQPSDFDRTSTTYNMGYEQAKRDMRRLLERALNATG